MSPSKTLKLCPLCRNKRDDHILNLGKYKLNRCSNCGMIWDPIAYSDSLYNKDYFTNKGPKEGYANYYQDIKINKKTFYERLKKIKESIGNKGKLLDVGCAFGDCLVEAKKLGWKDVIGVEISNFAYQKAKNKGLNVRLGRLTDQLFPQNSLDIILYQDVIEHIDRPLEELLLAQEVLKPGGLISIVTPNIEGLQSIILGKYWYHYRPREHVVYFSPRTLQLALEKVGFIHIKTRRTYHVLSLGYMLRRLKFYSPSIFGFLNKLTDKMAISNLAFHAFTGEFEATAVKPK